jgi:hypothetical protein
MKTIKCTFWIDVPNEVSKQDLEDWVKYELHQLGSLSFDNPMSGTEIEAKNIIVDTFQ